MPPTPVRRFHGIQPSKNTRERRAKKAAEEIAKKRLASEEGATSNVASLAQMKQASRAAQAPPGPCSSCGQLSCNPVAVAEGQRRCLHAAVPLRPSRAAT